MPSIDSSVLETRPLLKYTNGLTQFQHTILYGTTKEVCTLAQKGQAAGIFEQMLKGKIDIKEAKSCKCLDDKFKGNTCALGYLVAEGKLDLISELRKVNPEVVSNAIVSFRTNSGGSILHQANRSKQREVTTYKLLHQHLQDKETEAIARIQDKKGQNFLLHLLRLEIEHVNYIGHILKSLGDPLRLDLMILDDINNENALMESFIMLRYYDFKKKVLTVIPKSEVQKNFQRELPNNNSMVSMWLSFMEERSFFDLREKQDYLSELLGSGRYVNHLLQKNSRGQVPLLNLMKEKDMIRPEAINVLFEVMITASQEQIMSFIKSASEASGLCDVKKISARNWIKLFSRIDDQPSVVSFLTKSNAGKVALRRMVLWDSTELRKEYNKIVLPIFSEESGKEVFKELIGPLNYIQRLYLFKKFPEYFSELFLSSKPGEGVLRLSDSSVLGQRRDFTHTILNLCMKQPTETHLNQVLEHTHQSDFPVLAHFINEIIRDDLPEGLDKKEIRKKRCIKLFGKINDEALKRIVIELGENIVPLTCASFSLGCIDLFKRCFNLLDKEQKKQVVGNSSLKYYEALRKKDDDLIRFLLQIGVPPHLGDVLYVSERKNWRICRLLMDAIDSNQLIYMFQENIIPLSSLLNVSSDIFIGLLLAKLIKDPSTIQCQEPVTNLTLPYHLVSRISHEFVRIKGRVDFEGVLNKESISLVNKFFEDQNVNWVSEDTKLALYNNIQKERRGSTGRIKNPDFADKYSPKIEAFLLDFVCRVVVSHLPGFHERHAAEIPLKPSRMGLIQYRHHSNKAGAQGGGACSGQRSGKEADTSGLGFNKIKCK